MKTRAFPLNSPRFSQHSSIVLLTALLTLTLCTSTRAQDYRMNLRKTLTPMLEQKQYEEAIAACQVAAEKSSSNAAQAHCLTEASDIALLQLKDTDRALALAQKIRDPKLAASRTLVIHVQAKQYKKALEISGPIDIEQWPQDVRLDSYAARAEAYAALGQFDRAIADYDAASRNLGNVQRLTLVCFQLGQLHERHTRNPDLALQAYQRGLDATRANYAWRLRCFLRFHELQLDRGQIANVIKACEEIDAAALPSDYWRSEFYLLQAKAYGRNKQLGTEASILTKLLQLPGAVEAHKTAAQNRLQQLAGEMSSGK